ncbi:hypothetical protein AOZ06_05300 [Kibdelosporangium phytohabitans]|uniref:MalT-like TPR region domain-containing protein n=1 Tax=Kibdelosporangium phytohabitans TaxID=860235 RepID=A0A0N9HWG1_9PSEU|nr:hypothetical protein AOZ06_05300 [Kibdelosporangium phytohabitans]
MSVLLGDALHVRRALGQAPDDDEYSPENLIGSPFSTVEDVVEWFNDNRRQILATVQDAVANGEPETAAQLLVRIWPIVPTTTDAVWCAALRDCGQRSAVSLPSSRVMAAVFRKSAAFFLACGDHRVAETEAMRELAIWRRLDDPDGHVRALNSLSRIFQARGRLHRVIDCAARRLAIHVRHHRPLDVAHDLRHLGAVMLQAHRPDTAVDYLTRALDAFDELPETTARQHAELRVLLGRSLWLSGSHSRARRQFSDALQIVFDEDEAAADRIRELLATAVNATLPEIDHETEVDEVWDEPDGGTHRDSP